MEGNLNIQRVGLTPDRLRRIAEVLELVLELPHDLRDDYLRALGGQDPELATQVVGLLAGLDDGTTPVGDGQPAALPDLRPEAESGEPKQIGPYRVLRSLGAGGMGRVYLAERADEEFQRSVAIKVIRQGFEDEETHRRFLAERQILAAFDHPNIARMFEGGTTDDGRPYLVMEHIEGLRIDEYCYRNSLSVEDRLELFLQVCSAVDYAHRHLVIHRDLKPSNVLVTDDGTVKLLDFGVAKLLAPEFVSLDSEVTVTKLGPMTPHYASPEQIRGERISTASDVYSLGVVLYKILSGKLPMELKSFNYQELLEAFEKTRTKPPSRSLGEADTAWVQSFAGRGGVGAIRRRLQGDVDNITLMALHKDPMRRYRSAELLSRDIERHLSDYPVTARPDTFGYLAGKFVQRHRLSLALLTFVLLAIGSLAYTAQRQAVRAEEERLVAVAAQQEAEGAANVERELARFLVETFEVSNPDTGVASSTTAKDLLQRQIDRLRTNVGDDPLVQARFKEALGRALEKLAMHDEADELLKEVVETRVQELGNRHLEVGRALHNLGVAQVVARRFESAESNLLRALWIMRSHLGQGDPDLLRCMFHLGLLYDRSGKNLEKGLAYVAHAVDSLAPSQWSYDSKQVVQLHNQLGLFHLYLGRLSESQQIFESVLPQARRDLGSGHPVVGRLHGNLGFVLNRAGMHDLAEEHLTTAFEIIQANPTSVSKSELARIAFARANAYRLAGHLEVARDLFIENIEYVRAAGWETVAVENALGSIELALGSYENAFQWFSSALRSAESSPGSWALSRANILNNMGVVKVLSGAYSEGIGLYERSIALKLEVEGVEAEQGVASGYNNIGQAETLAGRYDRAEEAFQRAKGYYDTLDQLPRDATDYLKGYALLKQAKGQAEEAEKYFERALELWAEYFDDDTHPGYQEDLRLYAVFLREQGRDGDASKVEARLVGEAAHAF